MRFYQFLLLLPKLESHAPNLPKMTIGEQNMIYNRTKHAVREYLMYSSNSAEGNSMKDKDYQVFSTFYDSLLS